MAGVAWGQSVRQMGSTRHFFASSRTKAKQNLRACRQGRRRQLVGMDAPSGQREAAHGRRANLTAVGSAEAESRKETHDTAPPAALRCVQTRRVIRNKSTKSAVKSKELGTQAGGGWAWDGGRKRASVAGIALFARLFRKLRIYT